MLAVLLVVDVEAATAGGAEPALREAEAEAGGELGIIILYDFKGLR